MPDSDDSKRDAPASPLGTSQALKQIGWLARWSDGTESMVPLSRWSEPQPGDGRSPEVLALFIVATGDEAPQ